MSLVVVIRTTQSESFGDECCSITAQLVTVPSVVVDDVMTLMFRNVQDTFLRLHSEIFSELR